MVSCAGYRLSTLSARDRPLIEGCVVCTAESRLIFGLFFFENLFTLRLKCYSALILSTTEDVSSSPSTQNRETESHQKVSISIVWFQVTIILPFAVSFKGLMTSGTV